MKELIGRTVNSVWMKGDTRIIFQTDMGDLIYDALAACCSESWFADIIGVKALLGNIVTDVEIVELEFEQKSPRTRQEFDTVHGYKIKTLMGITDIVFRNSSNGCYSGTLSDGFWRQVDINRSNCRQITEDYSA